MKIIDELKDIFGIMRDQKYDFNIPLSEEQEQILKLVENLKNGVKEPVILREIKNYKDKMENWIYDNLEYPINLPNFYQAVIRTFTNKTSDKELISFIVFSYPEKIKKMMDYPNNKDVDYIDHPVLNLIRPNYQNRQQYSSHQRNDNYGTSYKGYNQNKTQSYYKKDTIQEREEKPVNTDLKKGDLKEINREANGERVFKSHSHNQNQDTNFYQKKSYQTQQPKEKQDQQKVEKINKALRTEKDDVFYQEYKNYLKTCLEKHNQVFVAKNNQTKNTANEIVDLTNCASQIAREYSSAFMVTIDELHNRLKNGHNYHEDDLTIKFIVPFITELDDKEIKIFKNLWNKNVKFEVNSFINTGAFWSFIKEMNDEKLDFLPNILKLNEFNYEEKFKSIFNTLAMISVNEEIFSKRLFFLEKLGDFSVTDNFVYTYSERDKLKMLKAFTVNQEDLKKMDYDKASKYNSKSVALLLMEADNPMWKKVLTGIMEERKLKKSNKHMLAV